MAAPRRWLTHALAATAFLVAGQAHAQSQGPIGIDAGGDLQVGGEAERYLRVLELVGLAPPQPWTIRPLAAPHLTANHPWRDHWSEPATSSGPQFHLLRPGARTALNTAFPFEVIRGPAWAGRGFTVEADAGFVATWGPLRAQVDPIVFIAQNASFSLAPNGMSGNAVLRDARFPGLIDAPQRFGTTPYGRLDPGNTTISIGFPRVTIGASTAAQSWGPAREFPLVLSASSGGFPHAFLATTTPVNLWIVRLHARVIAGTIDASSIAPPANPSKRWAAGSAITLLPRGLDGLEVGIGRFTEGFSASGMPTRNDIVRVFRPNVSVGGEDRLDENQVASAYFRWAVPRGGIEVYGEYYREDYTVQVRRLTQYPDDYSTYLLGLQRVRDMGNGRLRAYRFEILNGEMSSSNRRERGVLDSAGNYVLTGPQPPYTHGLVTTGHTNHGLFLGSAEAYGGAAWRIGFDDYDPRGRTSWTLERQLRLDWLPGAPTGVTPHPDVIISLRAERVRFVGAREVGLTVIPMVDLNRNLQAGHDTFNLAMALSVRGFR